MDEDTIKFFATQLGKIETMLTHIRFLAGWCAICLGILVYKLT